MDSPLSGLFIYMNYGERGRNRTFNLLIKSQLLCQLSYAPACEETLQKGKRNYNTRLAPHLFDLH